MQTPISSCVVAAWWSCGRQSFYFGVLEAKRRVSLTHSFPPNLNWQSCHSQCAHSPVSPEAPPDVFSFHLSFAGMWSCQQLCLNLRWWHHTTTSAPPEVTLLPYYSFILSAWWIMMLLPYLVCGGNHARASIAHSVAFHICASSLHTDLLPKLSTAGNPCERIQQTKFSLRSETLKTFHLQASFTQAQIVHPCDTHHKQMNMIMSSCTRIP